MVLKARYIIFAKDSKTFSRSYIKLTRATSWDPNAKIVIVMKYLSYSDIKEIFDLLLELHVVNVLLLNDTATVDLFTYNPYENYRCGRQYDRIIAFGQCIGQSEDKDLFYNKLITGLNRCTFRVTYTHFPPHAIDPSSSEFSLPGMNQYILSIIADKENFTINDTYKYNADEFSIIVNGSIAVGPLRALQTNKTDVVVGVMLLTGPRSRVFSYISDNYISIDYIVIQVARAQAGELSNILDEFRGIVWLSLLLVFVLYSALFLLINRNESKGVILLKLFGYLLLQSSQIRGGNKSRFVLIFWIVFAYLMNCYYLSNLVSFMTNPILEYQLASDKDIKSHNLKPCISRSVRHIVYNILNFTYPNADEKKCDDELESIRIVRRERNKFTVSLLSMYKYYETDLYDAHGKPTLYTISPPITKIIYATYLFKGFPMHSKLQEYYLRVGEVGLLSHHLSRLQAERCCQQHIASNSATQ
ncbi:uncharacterized protein LOC119834284 [Zerene cesonia]|uniref:uncharacterized protein LOC119834284 n=1 Tax=Zerene cesonia TaxID=33412 RepID=UPI0018E52730|nr:uncharacterized protein LOC119834284 [Zerene cesonia]